MRPLIAVVGTGTEVGKTHASVALLTCWGRRGRVCGVKPVETGVARGAEGDDARHLREASTFHVKHSPGVAFEPPISPHLAARDAGQRVDIRTLADEIADIRREADGVLVETAGGLFSPLTQTESNCDLVRALEPTSVLLVAADRLGVLHDVGATCLAARSSGLRITGIVLMAPPVADASTNRNAAEIRVVTDVPVLARLPRGTSEELSRLPDLATALDALTR